MKKYTCIFLIALILNLLWEFWHVRFYVPNVLSGNITMLLIIASLVDAVIITAVFWLSRILSPKYQLFGFIIALFIVAILIEKMALSLNLWAYLDQMPIVPILKIGLTPFIQLAATGSMTYLVLLRRSSGVY